ncbi:HD domain-containing protein [Candidatus Poribacteria bacterium]|nr:HD domain-containing protein [Candidatus Poribacteria bacterium]
MTKNEIIEWLKQKLNPGLYKHSLGTMDTALKLAEIHGYDQYKSMLAGLLHDRAKALPHNELIAFAREYEIPLDDIKLTQPGLLHAPVGALLVKQELGIDDEEVLQAIRIHNTGSKGMSTLDKILYLADSSEPNRAYPDVERIRELSVNGDLNNAVLEAIEIKVCYVLKKRSLLHPMTVEARNYILKEITN